MHSHPRLSLGFLLACALLTPSAHAQQSPPVVDTDALKRDAIREAKSKSKEGCQALTKELEQAWLDAMTRGLSVNLQQPLIGLRMSLKQRKGNLFNTEQGGKQPAGTNARAGDASCRVHLRSLREERQKNDAEMIAAARTPQVCKELAAAIQATCFPALRAGKKLPVACDQLYRRFNAGRSFMPIKRPPQPLPKKCTDALKVFHQLQKMRPRTR